MRLAGAMLQNTELHRHDNLKQNTESNTTSLSDSPTLSDLGLTRNESSTYQKIASIPEEVFEQEMESAKDVIEL